MANGIVLEMATAADDGSGWPDRRRWRATSRRRRWWRWGGRNGGNFRGRRMTTCSFCGKSSRDVGPMSKAIRRFICANCVDLATTSIKQEKRSSRRARFRNFANIPKPRDLKAALDTHIVGQDHASARSRSPSTTTTSACLRFGCTNEDGTPSEDHVDIDNRTCS